MISLSADRSPLGTALQRYRPALAMVAVLSGLLNMLLLGGSLYMMLVYDSVLPSHSIPTLMGLLVMVAGVFAFQGVFDWLRGRLLGDVAAGLEQDLAPGIKAAMLDMRRRHNAPVSDALAPMRDLDQVRGFIAGPGPAALIDLPWVVLFLGVLFALHVWLGVTALAGTVVMIALTALANRQTRDAVADARAITAERTRIAELNLRHAELFGVLGMQRRMLARWQSVDARNLFTQGRMARALGTYGGISRVARMFLQSLIFTVGALLVINGKATGGVIFASSILSGRALAPVDQAIANWRSFAGARLGWTRLNELLGQWRPAPAPAVLLPQAASTLAVQDLVAGPAGTGIATIRDVTFHLDAGSVLGIIGASASGKTSLGRALIGAWHPLRGTIRLDGATLDQWDENALGANIGYLPQNVDLIAGTVAENIARMMDHASSPTVIAAAKAAGAHEMILQLPEGYATQVGPEGLQLSGGQRQRIALARALYGDPFMVVLDEPNSNLDAAGDDALEQAIAGVRARGGIVVVIAHRAAALSQATHVLLVQEGRQAAFGPRDEVLAKAAPIQPRHFHPQGQPLASAQTASSGRLAI